MSLFTLFLLVLGLTLGVGTFSLDLSFSLGLSRWVGYFAMVLVGFWLPYKRYALWAGLGVPFLIFYGTYFPFQMSPTWVELLKSSASVMSIWILALFIFSRKQKSNFMFEKQKMLSSLIQKFPAMAYRSLNDPTRTMTFISEWSFQLTGYRNNDLIGNKNLSYLQLIHPDDREFILKKLFDAVKTKKPYRFAYRISTADEQIKHVCEQGYPLFDLQGNFRFLEGFITDVSHKVKGETFELAVQHERFSD